MATYKKGRAAGFSEHRPKGLHRHCSADFFARTVLCNDISQIRVDLRKLLAKAVNGTRELRPARAVLFSQFVAERLREVRS